MSGKTGNSMCLERTNMSPDEIEQRILCAYVQLACRTERLGSRTVAVARFGMLEARLTEIPEEHWLPDLPWYWLELYCYSRQAVVARCECTELDEHKLSHVVDLIANARHWAHGLH